jgi:hypothetical protein
LLCCVRLGQQFEFRHFVAEHFVDGHFVAGHFVAGHFVAGHFGLGQKIVAPLEGQECRDWQDHFSK